MYTVLFGVCTFIINIGCTELCTGLYLIHDQKFNSESFNTVATHKPTSQLSLSTINKLQIGMSILCFLSNLEENYNCLQELAGFELDCSHDYTFYTRSLLPKYIKSWAESRCSLTLTWKNFLHISRELKLTDVAEQIEKSLMESIEVHKHQLQAPDGRVTIARGTYGNHDFGWTWQANYLP